MAKLNKSDIIRIRINAELSKRKMSRVAFADLVGDTPQHIQRYLSGSQALKVSQVEKFERALGIELITVLRYV